VVLLGGIGAAVWSIDFRPNLTHLDVTIASGAPGGYYDATVRAVVRRARRERGHVHGQTSAGSIENLRRLMAEPCRTDFGLVQDGLDWTTVDRRAYERLELVARLPRPEMLLLIGRQGDAIEDFRDLRNRRIGAGPEGSGTAVLMRRLFEQPGFRGLGVQLVHAPVAEQIEAARRGELDLAAMVVYPDAPIVTRAIRNGGLSVASFRSAEAVAEHLDGTRAIVMPAGHFDAVNELPRRPVSVLAVDTLVVASHCASRSEINGVLDLLAHELPGFTSYNESLPPPAHLTMSGVAREYYDNHGTPMLDRYLPRIVDIIPMSNAMTLIMVISVLFNVMGFMNRFRLWRLDVARHKIEDELRTLFGGGITQKEIDDIDPHEKLIDERERADLEALIGRLNALVARTRKYAMSMLVPMGQEMVYRYQEHLMLELIAILRRFQQRMQTADRASG
jgi:TRAP-type uncharacterized transport system substrate-binding protein